MNRPELCSKTKVCTKYILIEIELYLLIIGSFACCLTFLLFFILMLFHWVRFKFQRIKKAISYYLYCNFIFLCFNWNSSLSATRFFQSEPLAAPMKSQNPTIFWVKKDWFVPNWHVQAGFAIYVTIWPKWLLLIQGHYIKPSPSS